MPLRFLVLLFLPVEPRIEPTGLFLLDGRLCGHAGVSRGSRHDHADEPDNARRPRYHD